MTQKNTSDKHVLNSDNSCSRCTTAWCLSPRSVRSSCPLGWLMIFSACLGLFDGP